MHELRFRAWFDGPQLMGNVITLKGSNRNNYEGNMWDEVTAECFIDGKQHFYSSYNFILLQYTGLKDKNGVDIFDGDIVLIEGNKNTLVSWSNKYSSFVLKNDTWLFQHWFGEACDATDCEVIGNIYQHKHLLK